MANANLSSLKGFLSKWANYIKGYKRRWFVLANGHLFYFKNEMANHCRGSMSLKNAFITASSSMSFTVSNGKQTYHIRAFTLLDGHAWHVAIQSVIDGESLGKEGISDEFDNLSPEAMKDELQAVVNEIKNLTEELRLYKSAIPRHWGEIQKYMTNWEENKFESDPIRFKKMEQKSAMFQLTATAMINKCCILNDIVQSNWNKFKRYIQAQSQEREQLEHIIECMALDDLRHRQMFQIAKRRHAIVISKIDNDDEDEYFDAEGLIQRQSTIETSTACEGESDNSSLEDTGKYSPKLPNREDTKISGRVRVRRMCVSKRPDQPIKLWKFLKNCIGQDLAHVSMPIQFAEPVSMLQRLTEEYEYSSMLDKAAECTEGCEQLAYLAAFAISTYSSTANRFTKPFNPLLGETYELDHRNDLGWRCISENVAHHPNIYAQHCEGNNWTAWQQLSIAAKFGGNYLEMVPTGRQQIVFPKTNYHFTWNKVTSRVNNIVIGSIWVEHIGLMEIRNQCNNDWCELKFHRYNYLREDSERKVSGWVRKSNGEYRWFISGKWDDKVEIAPVVSTEGNENPAKCKTGDPIMAWQADISQKGREEFYNFSEYTCQLNEPEERVAPTDSRRRPDQRYMEDGLWAKSSEEKKRLLEKQRAKIRLLEGGVERGETPKVYNPNWFKRKYDTATGEVEYIYGNEYWLSKEAQNWSRCPDIF